MNGARNSKSGIKKQTKKNNEIFKLKLKTLRKLKSSKTSTVIKDRTAWVAAAVEQEIRGQLEWYALKIIIIIRTDDN